MDTIYALSSGNVPSGIAVVRLSGPSAGRALQSLCGFLPAPRRAVLAALRDSARDAVLDRGMVVWLPAPGSFTGEDVAELHVHGSRAVLAALFDSLSQRLGLRLAEPGEFSRRAFLNQRIDLAEVEGLADLIAAETEVQRRQAVGLAGGLLSRAGEDWRRRLIALRVQIEAQLDFSDEGDVPEDLPTSFWVATNAIEGEFREVLGAAAAGERVRQGFRVALMGPPNAGKSTLLNALAQRDVAIVTPEPGTTRDVLEVPLDLGGYPVLLYDTAGLRESSSAAEREGVRRALAAGEGADLILWLSDVTQPSAPDLPAGSAPVWLVHSKADMAGADAQLSGQVVSARSGSGLPALLGALSEAAAQGVPAEGPVVARERHRAALAAALADLGRVRSGQPLEITADLLRSSAEAIGRISGRVDAEDVLDSIFREFCIGK